MDNQDIKMPTSEEVAEIVYNYCKENDIGYIREDQLVHRITDDFNNKHLQELKEKYNLDEAEYGKDKEFTDDYTHQMMKIMFFAYKLGKRMYEILDILERECKVDREIKDGEKFEYLTFFLAEEDVKSMQLVKSSIEIMARKVYNYCKENNIKYIFKEDFGEITQFGKEEKMNNKVLKVLLENYQARIIKKEEKEYIVFFLNEDDIALNKNMRLMTEQLADSIYNYCTENEIENIEKEELMKSVDMDIEQFNDAIEVLKEHKSVDEEINSEDGKTYLAIY